MKPKAISIFTGMGGLDFGFEAAGFDTAVALEWDPIACRTIRLNRPWPVLEGDVAAFRSETILSAGGLREAQADILIAGPPCQPFSKSGYWASGDARRLDDPRAGTLGQFLRILGETLPRAFLFENVLGFAYAGKAEGLEFIHEGVARINADTGSRYSIATKALNAADFGVPQMRERVFLVAARDGTPFTFPQPTHAPRGAAALAGLKQYATAWDALGDLQPEPNDAGLAMSGKWADLLASIPEGANYLWHTPRGGGEPLFGWRTRYWNFLLKLAKDQPSWTIQAQPGPATGPFHWRNRRLSTIELGRLQTFPDGLLYDCGRADCQRLIGNAVPSALAEIVARAIRVQLLRQSVGADLCLTPSARGDPPPAEKTSPVPRKYQSLIANHPAHPGTGRGRRAAQRYSEAA
jgi:DNA (cytosine-5)-methyltransferase 1